MKRVTVGLTIAMTVLFLLAPILTVVMSSFNPVGVFAFPPQGFTTRWYYDISASYYTALGVSVLVAVVTTAIATLVAVPGAIALARGRFPGRDVLNAVTLSPITVPGLVIGVALFQFALVIWDFSGISIGATLAGLVVGHLAFAIAFIVRSVLVAHSHLDLSIEEAALNLGATPRQTFFRVTLPTLKPGIVSGVVFAMLVSIDEVPISLFMGGGDATTLPVKIFTSIEIAFDGAVLAVSSLMVMGSIVLIIAVDRTIGLERLLLTKQ